MEKSYVRLSLWTIVFSIYSSRKSKIQAVNITFFRRIEKIRGRINNEFFERKSSINAMQSDENQPRFGELSACCLLYVGFLLDLFFNSEDGGNMFLCKLG
jgi:hypothetical protein